MFYKCNLNDYHEIFNGIKVKTLVFGEKTLFTEFRMTKGSILPPHFHPYEQTGYLIEGKLRLKIGDEIKELEKGDCWCITENVTHNAEILEDSVAIEIFSPVREDYKKYKTRLTE